MSPQTILLFLIGFLVGSDEFLLGPILTPIGADLGVAPERITLFIGAYALPLALLAPLFGGLSDRRGRRTVLLPAVCLFCLGSLGTALAPGYGLALLSRIVTGVGAAGMLPVAFAAAADSGPDRAPGNIAAVQAGLTGGIILAPVYGAWITQAFGWHNAFIGLAALSALSIPGMGWLRPQSTDALEPIPESPLLVPGALGAIIAMGFGLGGAIGIYALVGERLRDITDFGTGEIGLVYAGFGIITFLGNLLMPWSLGLIRSGRPSLLVTLQAILTIGIALIALRPPRQTSRQDV